jgi:two-component system OmpR family sensor kinase/two-component system sensor histidine kinase QseC
MAPHRSLRLRLFGLLVTLAALAALAVGTATYFSVRKEADALFDYQLRQVALTLRDQGRIPDEQRAALADPDLDVVVQVWSIDGVSLYTSHPGLLAHPLPPSTTLGFSTVLVGGDAWRVFGAATPLHIVQVGQPLAVRQRMAAAAAGRSVLPIVVAAPLVGLAMWSLVGMSLAPLQRVVSSARTRDPDSFEPLPAAGLPSEVEPLVDAFNGLLARLAVSFEAQRHFVADAAHELRSPLTALKLQVGLLQGSQSKDEHDAAVARLRAGIDRAARLVEQLLALARAAPGGADAMADVDLVHVARQAIADASAPAAARQAVVELDAPATLRMRGDAQALGSLVRNLVDNAIKHGGSGVRIRVSIEQAGPVVRLRVDDSGPGIPRDERERAFDRFYRREGSGSEGSGLGLAIARAIASQHAGTVALDDAPLGGLRVAVTLPASAP